MRKNTKIALIGNPNTGKTSLFNQLTGLKQQVGNYPGVTVEKKIGQCKTPNNHNITIIDLPGTYSINTTSKDEKVVIDLLTNPNDNNYPDALVVVTDVTNLQRNLLIFSQMKSLNFPILLVINMKDMLTKKGIDINLDALSRELKTPIILTNSRTGEGIKELKTAFENLSEFNNQPLFDISNIDTNRYLQHKDKLSDFEYYKAWLNQSYQLNYDDSDIDSNNPFSDLDLSQLKKLQHTETVKRFQQLKSIVNNHLTINPDKAQGFTEKLDNILTHKVWGYLIFFAILFLIFQSLFAWSTIPMDFIDNSFGVFSSWLGSVLPEGTFTNLIIEGLIPGIAGVLVFVPQIAFLFLFISLLEESGYMSRVVVLMDKLMKPLGMSGKSVVSLISGTACAIPAIMATRNIENWRQRLITILITPFTTCSARIPVYTILIAIVIPSKSWLGLFNLQGLVMFLLYCLGFVAALISGYILHKILKTSGKAYFVVELPDYKVPFYKNVVLNIIEKTKAFVFGAGKIIVSLTIVLWFLASYSPSKDYKKAQEQLASTLVQDGATDENIEDAIAAFKLEKSYIGIFGKSIEPVIEPLGYDWKIGIGLISSFAAREVFVGTMATIYSIGKDSEDETGIIQKMASEVHPVTKKPIYNYATGISLMLFYAFAMQCISTLAIVKKETNSWKWPLIQLFAMTTFAYLISLLTYQILS